MPKKRAGTKTKYKNEVLEPPASQRNTEAAKRWLWIWVSFFTIIIVGLWGWATKISFSSFRWNKTPEKQLLETSKDDWNTLFNQETDRIKNEQIKRKLQTMVKQIIAEAASSTLTSTIATTSTASTTTAATTPLSTQ